MHNEMNAFELHADELNEVAGAGLWTLLTGRGSLIFVKDGVAVGVEDNDSQTSHYI